MVLNYQIQESDEETFVPFSRAVDYFKLLFANKLTQASMTVCLKAMKTKAYKVKKSDQQRWLHLAHVT
jgi:hypothetical protein